MDLLKKLGIDENTLMIFSSDNGTTFNGGSDAVFFNSVGPLRRLKCSLYEGGIRVPMIARWPGKIKPGTTTDHISAFWDILPTIAEIINAEIPADIDVISLLPALLGKKEQKKHSSLYWEYHGYGSIQAVRMGDWKGIRKNIRNNPNPVNELYNLKTDIGETQDVAAAHPDIVKKIKEIMEQRTVSQIEKWNF